MDNIKYNEDKESYIVFAQNLKYYLKENEKTQKELGDAIGVSQGTICDWMKTRTYPRLDKIEKIANYFGVEKSDLIEAHTAKNKHYRTQAVSEIAKELHNNPESVDLWLAIKKLSTADREIVQSLINSLARGK